MLLLGFQINPFETEEKSNIMGRNKYYLVKEIVRPEIACPCREDVSEVYLCSIVW